MPEGEQAARLYLADYLGLLLENEGLLMLSWHKLCEAHPTTPDVSEQGILFAGWSLENADALRLHVSKMRRTSRG